MKMNHADISHKELLGQLEKKLLAQLTHGKSGLSKWAWCTENPTEVQVAGGGQGWL